MARNRRDFLKYTAAALSVAAGTQRGSALCADAPLNLRVRRNVTTLDESSEDIQALKKAVVAMRGLPNTDGRSWLRQASIHGMLGGGFGNCQHMNWFFLPWHRAYLSAFEKIVQKLSGKKDFSLPYWDWTRDRSLPKLFWGDSNPLNNVANGPSAGRRTGLTAASTIEDGDYNRFLSLTVISKLFTDDFETFGGSAALAGARVAAGDLEGGAHNFIHRWVGGDMGSGGSPYDPIFWLHHCNVDRLWSEWTRKNSTGTPSDVGWLGQEFKDFFDGDGAQKSFRVKDVLDIGEMGYRYDSSPTAPSAPPSVKNFKVSAFLGSAPANFADEHVAFSLISNDNFAKAINDASLRAPGETREAVRMIIKGIQPPKNQDVSLDIYLNCAKLTRNTPIADPTYVGSRTFFTHDHGDHKHESIAFSMNVTSDFQRLYGDRSLKKDEPLTVSIIARQLFGKEQAVVDITNLDPQQVSFEVIHPSFS